LKEWILCCHLCQFHAICLHIDLAHVRHTYTSVIFLLKCFAGDEVIYLDPHTTQPAGLVEEKEHEHERALDSSYHCQYASRMHILHMDPSVAAVRKTDVKWLVTLS
jgi:hypothetical protein